MSDESAAGGQDLKDGAAASAGVYVDSSLNTIHSDSLSRVTANLDSSQDSFKYVVQTLLR